MIIIKDQYGQLGNRIWAASSFISYAVKNNKNLVIVFLYDYSKYFQNLNSHPNVTIVKSRFNPTGLLMKLLIKIGDKTPEKILNFFNMYYHENIDLDKKKSQLKLIFINGWFNKKPKVDLNLSALQQIFKPNEESILKVSDSFESLKKNSEIIVGVHIRRGDYKDFDGGIYYYDDQQYLKILKQLSEQIGESKNIMFLLCSNSPIELKVYNEYSIFQIENPNLMDDLYALSKCDYIIGPPSTYSMWASYYGQKPLLFITEQNFKFDLKDFSIVKSQYKFENGKEFRH